MATCIASSKYRTVAVLLALLVVHSALLAWSAVANSVTFDEYAHLPAGVSYWHSGRFDIYDLSPPLLRLLGSWPAVLAGASAPSVEPFLATPPNLRHWDYADQFLRQNWNNYQKLFVLGRLGLIPISCLGIIITYVWAAALYRRAGGLLAATLYALCPNMLAHGSIVGTDAGTTVAMLAACWLWWRFCRRPTLLRWTWATLATAAALLCKFTALLLWPEILVIAALTLPRCWRAWRIMLPAYIGSGLACLLLINAAYGFEGTGRPLGSFTIRSTSLRSLHLLPRLRLPLPAPWIEGIDMQNREIEMGGPGFLFGKIYSGSRWYYYPVALAFKLPLGTILLILWSAASAARWLPPRKRLRRFELVLPALAAVFLFTAMFLGRTDLGVRYVLPCLPFAFIFAGRLWPHSIATLHAVKIAIAVLLVGVCAATLSVAPRFLTFFNVLAGGPSHGYKILNDSNFDWGQGLLDLHQWMQAHHVARIRLAYFGKVDPSVYGIDYVPLTRFSNDRYVAVSSYYLVGMAHHLPTRHGPTPFVHLKFYRELQHKRPVAVVGSTIFIYESRDFDAAALEHAMKQ